MARLKDMYKADVAPALMKKFSYKSVMQIPKLEKIVINVGAGEAKENARRSMPSAPIWLRSPARSPRFAKLRSLLQTLSCVKA